MMSGSSGMGISLHPALSFLQRHRRFARLQPEP
jgi:hypothetical protein